MAKLTDRQIEIAKLVAEGYTNAEISEKLYISIHTAKAHIANILAILGLENRCMLTAWCFRNKILR
ncbi:MAG: helix-turn-helix transcriptional regulator [Candidatus Gastranaerophilales bacterium]|nr:helix-turn-helix transcriptional regulator [Candidatus Gastranaerophilales bacterium]MCM1072244.1 helix-turn-helix transcriptional regulator [Bacteroides sp.]